MMVKICDMDLEMHTFHTKTTYISLHENMAASGDN